MKFYVGCTHVIPGDDGPVCCSAAYWPRGRKRPPETLLDSGAYTDSKGRRLSFPRALERQLLWEERARRAWDEPSFQATAFVSYDRLINHQDPSDSDLSVTETVEAARYLNSQRERLAPRALVMACQGHTPEQYESCTRQVLDHCRPGDWLGLGGWCIIGRYKRRFDELRQVFRKVIPLARERGLTRAHLFGVMWESALALFQYHSDQAGIEPSTDSSAPLFYARMRTSWGCAQPNWPTAIATWRRRLSLLRQHYDYQP
jgi:hypothetical protein